MHEYSRMGSFPATKRVFVHTWRFLRSALLGGWVGGHRPVRPLSTAPIMASLSKSQAMAFIDIGANLLDPMFSGRYHEGKLYHSADLESVLQRSWDAGVTKIIITAGNLEESHAALKLARSHDQLYSTVGVHPTKCSEIENYPAGAKAYLEELAAIIEDGQQDGKVVAVGECGLDYDRLEFCDAATQQKWFAAHFQLAKVSSLPMFLHLRAASRDFMCIVQKHSQDFSEGVVHSFDGTLSELQDVLSMPQLHIGLNGCSLKTAENLTVAGAVPVDRLHLETDAPWCEIRSTHAGAEHVRNKLAARDKKKHDPGCLVKGRNEPCNITQVFDVVAAVRGAIDDIERTQLAAQIMRNTTHVYFSGP